MPIALGYGRKSVVRTGADIVGVDKQRLAVSRLVDQRGETLEWYEDAEGHRSGRFERTRPGFQHLLARIEHDTVASVIVYDLDRAARSVLLIDRLIKLCQAHDVAFICIKDGIDTSRGLGANEIMRIQLLAVLAEGEANRVAERMRDTATYYRDELRIAWGMWPFGFDREGEGKHARFVPDPPHDDTVRRALSIYLSGTGYRETARELTRLGFQHVDRYGRTKPFNTETVRTVVGNVLFYAGYCVGIKSHAKQATVTLTGDGSYLERYARTMRAERSVAIVPIIDDDTANAIIERRSKNEWTGRQSSAWVALLTPIAYWRGQKLRAQVRDFGRFYRTRGTGGACFDGEAIDAAILRQLRAVCFPPAMRSSIRALVVERVGESARASYKATEARALAEMDLLLDLLAAGQLDRVIYNTRFARLEAQLHDARAALDAPSEVDRLMEALTDLAGALDMMTPAKRKQAIQHIFERVDIGDSGEIVRVYWRAWALSAFQHIAESVPKLPPVSDSDEIGTPWLLAKTA